MAAPSTTGASTTTSSARATAVAPGQGWGRGRLLAVFAGLVCGVVVLVAGLGYAVVLAVRPDRPDRSPAGAGGRGVVRPVGRDQIAAAPMLAVASSDALPAAPAATLAAPVVVPAATSSGPAGVPTGFPRTPQGALGQLAAIDATVLEAMSIAAADAVYRAWAMPGGVGVARWQVTGSVQAFLGATGMGSDKDLTVVIRMTPAGVIVKGVDGPDWTLACVLFQVQASWVGSGRVGYGDCQRMQWDTPTGRWMIGPGVAPVRAPSVWPGSDLAARAGWRRWVTPTPDQQPDPLSDPLSGQPSGQG